MEDATGRGAHLKAHRYPPGTSGNLKGKPVGTIGRKTVLRHVLDIRFKATDEIVQKVRDKWPELFTDKRKKWFTVEELISMVHVARALMATKADHVRIDVLNRTLGKPIQAVMTLDPTASPDDLMDLDQTKSALARIRDLNNHFESSKTYGGKDPGEDSEG